MSAALKLLDLRAVMAALGCGRTRAYQLLQQHGLRLGGNGARRIRDDKLEEIRRATLTVEATDVRAAAVQWLLDGAGYIYFVRCGDPDGPVKIGIAGRVDRRLKGLQSASPQPLTLLGFCCGGEVLESALHRRFAADRIRGEWFRQSEELLALLAALRTQGALRT